MMEPSIFLSLFIVNLYLILALSLYFFSSKALLCRVRHNKSKLNSQYSQQRKFRVFIAIPLMLTCLGLLFLGLFILGMSHGSRPKDHEVFLFILACFTPFVLLIIWIVGRLWVDVLWFATCTGLLIYFLLFNPSLYVRYWADAGVQGAQMWIAEHYERGEGGLRQSASMARSWYKKAAIGGDPDAQYRMGLSSRRGSTSIKWYLKAAEQGHADAMVYAANLSVDKNERKQWLEKAAEKHHSEALFLLAKDAMRIDLAQARQWMIEAAKEGSRSAIVFLVNQYQEGGLLFDKDAKQAKKWAKALGKAPDYFFKSEYHNAMPTVRRIDREGKNKADSADSLYRKAQSFLRHPAKDSTLHQQAMKYLTLAANKGHGDASVELAKIAMKKASSKRMNVEALKWYRQAAAQNNIIALKELTKYYKEKPEADVNDLKQSLAFNQQLLEALHENKKQIFPQRMWSSEYHDTKKKIGQLERIGGSWQKAITQAKTEPEKEYQLAEEMLKSRQYSTAMQHMKSAAQRGNNSARYYLAKRTLQGPRSFMQEINAITELQLLERLNYVPATLRLAFLYQSATGDVPKNLYLSRQLFLKVIENDTSTDRALAKQAQSRLEKLPVFIESLTMLPTDDVQRKIEQWYQMELSKSDDPSELDKQYVTLLEHFRDINRLKEQAKGKNAQAQYELAQSLQSINLSETIQWLELAAKNGHSDAQYELSLRMIQGKKNPPSTIEAIKKWSMSAAENGHVGAMVFIAIQLNKGTNGFAKNIKQAQSYYRKALQSAPQQSEIIFQGKIAGRMIYLKRSSIEKKLI